MDKNDYFLKLRKELKRVSPEDIDDAVRYYEEYSEDAGFTDGEQLVNEFGTPKDLAKKIIVDIVDKNYVNNESKTKEEKKAEKKQKGKTTVSTPLLVLLAIFAVPMSPVILALIIVLFVLIFVAFVVLAAMIVVFAALVFAGLISLLAGAFSIIKNPGEAMVMIGTGLIVAALGYGFCILFVWLIKMLSKGCLKLGGKIVHSKKEKKVNE